MQWNSIGKRQPDKISGCLPVAVVAINADWMIQSGISNQANLETLKGMRAFIARIQCLRQPERQTVTISLYTGNRI